MTDSTPTHAIRILVVDDHPVVRDGLIAMLSTQQDFVVVGEASGGAEAVRRAALLRPDVIIMDLEMPDIDGVEALQRLRLEHPEVKVIAFTAFDSDERILAAVKAGAMGYLLKGTPRRDLFQAIRVVHEGGSLLQPVVATKLLRHMSGGDSEGALAEPLTRREQEVLELLGRGRTNRAIAAELVISERTVKFHVSSILGKLGAANRTEAVTIALQHGLLDLG